MWTTIAMAHSVFSRRLTGLLAGCLGLAVLWGWSAVSLAQPFELLDARHFKNGSAVRAAFAEVVANASEATVRIKCDGEYVALGTIVDSRGWVVTKASELAGSLVCRLKDGRELEARLVDVQEEVDLALLKIEGTGLRAVEWCPDEVAVGQWVATPDLADEPVAVGIVSVLPRVIPSLPGDLGVRLEDGGRGPRVSELLASASASEAEWMVGDLIVEVNGKPVSDLQDLANELIGREAGSQLRVMIQRDTETLQLVVTLVKKSATATGGDADAQNRLDGGTSDRAGGFALALQHDSLLRPVDCGGPLVNLRGQVVGINIARAGRTESFAIPATVVVELVESWLKQQGAGS